MLLNGKTFKIYDYDTQRTVVERIASVLRTIPKYLWYVNDAGTKYTEEPKFIEETPNAITVINIILDIETQSLQSLSEFESRYSDWFIQSGNTGNLTEEESKENLLKWFVIDFIRKNKNEGISEEHSILLLEEELKEGVGGREFDLNFPKKIWNDRSQIEKDYNKNVKENRTLSAQNEKRFKDLDKMPKASEEFSKFVVEKIKVSFTVTNYETTMLSLFNIIDINKVEDSENSIFRIVTVTTANFFKINGLIDISEYKRIDPSQLIENSSSCIDNILNIIIMNEPKQKREGKQSKRPEFIDITVKPNNESLLIEFDLSISIYNSEEDRNILKNYLIETLFSQNSLQETMQLTVGPTLENKVKGSYYIINRYFQKEIFLDMIMNDPDFSILYVDERFKVSKQQSRLYVYFVTTKTGIVAFSLLNQVILTENDPLFKIKTPDGKKLKVKVGTQYIKIRISSIENKLNIPFFQDHLNRLFSLYFLKYNSILQFYNLYIKITPGGLGIQDQQDINLNIDEPRINVPPRKKIGDNTLAAQVPELFLPLYSRKCARAPRIVSEEEALELNKNNFQTIKFPIHSEGNLEPKIYACDHHKEHPYPGLKPNDLANKDTFKYLPCCYKTNPEHKRGSPYGNYYKGEALTKDMTDHELYKTPRIVPNKVFGILPTSIAKIFGKENDTTNYYRYGTMYGINSFIDAVARAVGNNQFENIYNERQTYISEIRKKMASESYIGLSRQETYDINIEIVKKWIKSDQYFDPKRFLKIVEDYFDVTIFLFERNVGESIISRENNFTITIDQISETVQKYGSGGQLSVPIHSTIGSYILRPLKNNVVFIYTHMGSEVDKVLYPQCETIIKYTEQETGRKKGTVKSLFQKHDHEVEVIKTLFDKLLLSYTSIMSGPDIPFSYEPINTLKDGNGLILKEQFIDKSGKTRMLYASWVPKSSKTTLKEMLNEPAYFTIVTEPIHPLRLPIKQNKNRNENLCIPLSSSPSNIANSQHFEISPITNELVDDLMKIYNLNYKKASFKDYLCNASDYLKGQINGIKVRIYVSNSVEEMRRNDSTLLKYNKQRKISRILFEYVLYKFSEYIKSHDEYSKKEIFETFLSEKCLVDNSFLYKINQNFNVPFFTLFDKMFMVNGKIIFSSQNLMIKIMYNIYQLTVRKFNKVKELSNQTIMNTYFENLSDFNHNNNFFIVYGLNTFLRFVSETKQGELLLNTLQPFDGPRFFSSDDIEDGKIFSAFCYGSIDTAIANQLSDKDIDKTENGIVYIFDTINGYEAYQINYKGVKIVAFKVEDGEYYLTLKETI